MGTHVIDSPKAVLGIKPCPPPPYVQNQIAVVITITDRRMHKKLLFPLQHSVEKSSPIYGNKIGGMGEGYKKKTRGGSGREWRGV